MCEKGVFYNSLVPAPDYFRFRILIQKGGKRISRGRLPDGTLGILRLIVQHNEIICLRLSAHCLSYKYT